MVLEKLISTKGVSEQQLGINGFRTRISELRAYLPIQYRIIKFVTRFGKPSQFKEHYLKYNDKRKAIKLYKELNK